MAYGLPDDLRGAMDERYAESERRMRELAGKQQALQNRALRSQGAQRGFTGARNAGAELSVLGNIGAQTSAEVIQKSRELESQRLAELQKWAEGERGYEQQRGLAEQGYGHQRGLQQMKQDFEGQQNALNRQLQDELTRGGWTEEAKRLQMQLDANESQWTSELAWEQEYGRGTLGIEQGKLELSEKELEQAARQHAAEMGLSYDQLSEQEKARIMQDTRERYLQEQQIASAEGMQQAGFDQDRYMQEQVAELTRQGWTEEAARQQAALQWEHEKMYGPGSSAPMDMLGGAQGGGAGFGGYGGTYGLEQQKLQLEQQKLDLQEQLTREGWDRDSAAAEADRQFQQQMQESGFGHDTEMAETNARLNEQLEEFKANRGQIAGAMQNYSDWLTLRIQGEMDIGRFNQAVDNLNIQLAELYGDTWDDSMELQHWEASRYPKNG